MNPKHMLRNLTFLKEVTAKRQTYYIYKSSEYYLLLTVSSFKPNSYNLSALPVEAVDVVFRIFRGMKGLTAKEVVNLAKKPAYIKERFDALNALYTLCAIGRATIDRRHTKGSTLYFNLKSR